MDRATAPLGVRLFGHLPDPRVERTKLHALPDLLIIAICTVIGGGSGWEDMHAFGSAKEAWLRRFLVLEHGIPSPDTFRRVFARLDPLLFQEVFLTWVQSLSSRTEGQVVAVDGKKLRHSFETATEKPAIQMISAWASEQRLVIGQQKVDDASNEITAIPKLLELLELSGCIVTIDAAGCQTAIAEHIIEQNAEYVLALKENQPTLYEDVRDVFLRALRDPASIPDLQTWMTEEYQHGRSEIRQYFTTGMLDSLRTRDHWKGLSSIGMVLSDREVHGVSSIETRLYILSFRPNVERFGRAVRTHWEIENCVHYVLDVTFAEDDSRIRRDNGPQNVAVLRHIALNLFRQEIATKGSIRAKRLRAGWDDAYLAKVIGLSITGDNDTKRCQ
jgi:predicted transposase YbfD/YdcC